MNLSHFFNRRIIAITLLSFSSGLPLALTYSTLQAWYTVAGVSLVGIGALSLVGQPYIYKFLWAPLMDRFTPSRLGRRRGWIFCMQFAMVVGLVVMAFLNPSRTPWLLASTALGVAFFSASQDIAFDAYRTDLLKPSERGLGAAVNTIGYRMAMLVSGALALVLAAEIGWRVTYLIMAGLLVIEMFITLWSPELTKPVGAPTSLSRAIVEPIKEFMTRKNAILILIFIVIYKLTDAFALSLNTPFLIRGLGFSLVDVGTISKTVGLAASLLGSFIGGILFSRLGMYRSLMIFGVLQMSSNLAFALLAMVGKSFIVMGFAVFVEYFCGGLSTVAFVAFLMSLCNRRYTATQFALFSALSALGRVFAGPEAAIMVDHVGWAQLYVWTFVIGIPALLLLWWLNRRVDFSAEQIAA